MAIPARTAAGVPFTGQGSQLTDYQGTPINGPSGQAAVTGSFTGTGASGPFLPITGRDFNVTVNGTYSATISLERSFDYDIANPSAATWVTCVSSDLLTAVGPSLLWNEPEWYVIYRLHCTAYVSGTATYRISQ